MAIRGLAFEPRTDDLRGSPASTPTPARLAAGAEVSAPDPVAMPHARPLLGNRVRFAATSYDASDRAHALTIVTDWNEYPHPDVRRMHAALERPIVVDGRNRHDPALVTEFALVCRSIGRPAR